jgi:hypothetical protein
MCERCIAKRTRAPATRDDMVLEGEARQAIMYTKYTIQRAKDRRDGKLKWFVFGPTGFIFKTVNARRLRNTVLGIVNGKKKTEGDRCGRRRD